MNEVAKEDDIVKYTGIEYQMVDASVIDDKFTSIENLVKAENSRASKLYDYCNTINSIVKKTGTSLSDWMFNSTQKNELVAIIKNWFIENKWRGTYLKESVDKLVDKIVNVDGFQSLSYFRSYLTEHLKKDFESEVNDNKDNMDVLNYESSILEFAKKVVGYIEKQVQTTLVLGGYDGTTKEYPGISNFIYQTNIKLSK